MLTIFLNAYGTCDHPKDQNCCRAASAIVQQMKVNSKDPSLNHFVVTQTCHTRSFQSMNHGGLESVAWLVDDFHKP